MHELGIITGVLDVVNQTAKESNANCVLEVRLRVGEMTEAIEDALQFSFEALRELPEYSLCSQAKLTIIMVPPKSHCLECDNTYVHDRFTMLCPACGSFAVELLEGRELEIESIEVDL